MPRAPQPERSQAYERAIAAQRSGRTREAIALSSEALAADSSLFKAQHLLGLCHEELGEFELAITHYREALRIKPDHARSLANLIALPTFEAPPELLGQAQTMLENAALEPMGRAKLHHALGKLHERRGEHDAAFAHFARSNAAQRTMLPPFDRASLAATVDMIIATFDAPLFAALRDAGNPSRRPIFVVGLPRSGTTLVEQILASHPDAFGAGELLAMTDIAKEALLRMRSSGEHAATPRRETAATESFVTGLDSATVQRLAQAYLSKLDALASPGASRVVDKLPFNFAHLGLIAILFPRAAIVHCQRNVLDVALSCYIETFRQLAWTMDLGDIGFYIAQKERLMEHWRRVLPSPIHEVDYSRLIDEQESETRALLTHCGLEWNEACLEFFRTERHVNTPSRWQVRQPIYGSSRERWRRYRRHLDPLLATLPAGLRTDT